MYIGIHAFGTKAIREAKRHRLGNFIWIPKWGYGLGIPHGYAFPEGGWAPNITSGYDPGCDHNPALQESLMVSVEEAMRQGFSMMISGRRGLADYPLAGGFFVGGDSSGDFLPPELLRRIEETAGDKLVGIHLEELDSDFCQNGLDQAYMDRCPEIFDFSTRAEAREKLQSVFDRFVRDYRSWGTEALLNTTLTYHHYAFRADCKMVLAEVMEHLTNVSVQYAYLRGAQKQYGGNWGIWVSPWFWGKVPTNDEVLWPSDYTKEGLGHSPFSFECCLLGALFSGATLFTQQETEPIFIRGEEDAWELGEWGRVLQHFSDFALEETQPRHQICPVAMLLDEDTGWSDGGKWQSFDKLVHGESFDEIWGKWRADRHDHQIDSVLDVFYPGYARSGTADIRSRDQEYPSYFSKTPFGQMEVLLNDCTQEVLDTYRLVILAGPMKWNHDLADKLIHFLGQGGKLVISTEQLRTAPAVLQQALGVQSIAEERSQGHLIDRNETCTELLPLELQLDLKAYNENMFWYRPAQVKDSSVLASIKNGEPVVHLRKAGKGLAVINTMDGSVESRFQNKLSRLEREILEQLAWNCEAVQLTPDDDIEYMLDQMPDRSHQLLLINHGRWPWEGRVTLPGLIPSQAQVIYQTEDKNGSVLIERETLRCSLDSQSLVVIKLTG